VPSLGESFSMPLVVVPRLSTSPNVILMAKSGIHALDGCHAPEYRVCQRVCCCEPHFAISIKRAQEPDLICKAIKCYASSMPHEIT
jgi:hypothetical protein